MVVGVTGHQNLPPLAVPSIAAHIKRELARAAKLEGICSLAAGADQLFATLVLKAGGSLHVVIPSRHYETTFSKIDELANYRKLLDCAAVVEEIDYDEPSDTAFFEAGQRVVDVCDRLIAIWDGKPARGVGGTADIVRYAQRRHRDVSVIWPKDAVR